MRFVFASDSFKGSLSSDYIGELLETAAHEAFPDSECIVIPVADGGEGTLDAISSVRDGTRSALRAHDGLMRPIDTEVFFCGNSAFVEAASTCGLTLIGNDERNPLAASSYGVGECVRFALERGYDNITVGLGGSCTNDGGMGCLQALGIRFLDSEGRELDGRGSDLERVAIIDESGLHSRARQVSFKVMNDVDNPLLGPCGATYVFGPQKGAHDQMLDRLERGMHVFAESVAANHPMADFSTPGFGAAGGLGMAFAVFLNAEMRSGIEELLNWIDFDAVAKGADLVVTGEGKLDDQSLRGKAVSGIAAHAKRIGVPVVAICGSVALDEHELSNAGISRAINVSEGQPLEYAMSHAAQNYLEAARHLFSSLRCPNCNQRLSL